MTTGAAGVLAGRYRLDERIAVGGMGEVWRAEDTVLGRSVAVKCLKPEYVDDAEFRERFRAEARHAAGLSHPGIASVFDYGEQVEPEKSAWLVMELVDGEPLSTLLRRTGRLPAEQALDLVGQAALALEAAHLAGVVHRDVKPGNLLVRPDGVVKVTDFGIARATDAVPITRTGTVVGTAYYLSPEQASGAAVTPASDVYSLGVVAYECLAGERPFPGTNPVAVATAHLHNPPPPLPDDVPAPVRDLVLRALEKDPARRPAHAGELGRTALALRTALLEGNAAEALPVEPPAPARPEGAVDRTRALTTVTPPVAEPLPRPQRPQRPQPRRGPGTNHQRSVRLALALLLVLLVALSFRSCSGPAEAAVPKVTAGSTVAAATALLDHAHLGATTRSSSSTTVPVGRVIGTDPAAGTALHQGDRVVLLVSSGRPKVTVSSATYAGKSLATVRDALTRLGLKPTVAYDGKGTPAGTVSGVNPTGSLAYGSPVVIHVVPVPAPAPAPRTKHGKHGKGD